MTISAGLVSYPIDTIRRRMMMTSGEAVKYKGSMDCAVQVIKNEGFMSLMKGAGMFHVQHYLSDFLSTFKSCIVANSTFLLLQVPIS